MDAAKSDMDHTNSNISDLLSSRRNSAFQGLSNSADVSNGPSRRVSVAAYSRRSSVSTAIEPRPPEQAHLTPHGLSFTGDAIQQTFISIAPARPSLARIPSMAPSAVSSGISVDRMSVTSSLVDLYQALEPGIYQQEMHNDTGDNADNEKDSLGLVGGEEVKPEDSNTCTVKMRQIDEYAAVVADADLIDSLAKKYPLPESKGWDESLNQLRYGFMSAYRRLFGLAFLINLFAIVVCIALYATEPGNYFGYGNAATATGANLLMTALMRHEHCINALFRIVCLLPHRTPLRIRRHAAKIYCYGGLHSGCGVSAALWYVFYSVLVVRDLNGTEAEQAVVSCTTGVTLVMLALIVFMAHPLIRSRWHNQWEVCHRYGAWSAILMVWVQTVAIAITNANVNNIPSSYVIIQTPTFWFLCVITICIAYPWIRMRRVKVKAEPLSSHAVRLHFSHCSLPYCVGNRLTDNPLKETHGFATIANSNGEKGYSCLVSNAGDWTKRIIDNPPEYLWIRGAPTLGVMRVATLFKPIVVVATGSGIGPCLSFLSIRHDYPMRVLWSARFPESTYGSKIMRTVFEADKDAVIIDTRRTGHPNLLQVTWALVKESNAEAVIIISNPKVTRQVVYGLETRHVPAFGAVFDS